MIDRVRARDGGIAVLCGLGVVVAVAATWPVAELGFNDDWSYAWTVKRLADTGRLTYNGWASASLVAQAYWGLLWVKAFGYSFTTLRLSTVPFAAAAVSVCYLLGRRAGLAARWAAFAALVVGWSPLFLPVAATFMTDAPGLFFILSTLYAVVRGVETSSRRAAVGWLAVAAVVGLVGGTGRQIVWVAPGVGLLLAAWVYRRDAAVRTAAGIGWVVTVAGAVAATWWFAHQDYAIPEPSPARDLLHAGRHPLDLAAHVAFLGLTLVLAVLPAAAGLCRGRTFRAVVVAVGVAYVGLAGVRQGVVHSQAGRDTFDKFVMLPWMLNTLMPTGITGTFTVAGDRPVVLPVWVRMPVSAAVVSAAVLVVVAAARARPTVRKAVADLNAVVPGRPAGHRVVGPLLAVFAAGYLALLLPRTARDKAYDRYLLELMPCVMFPLLATSRPGGGRAVAGWAVLGVWAAYAVASTQEETALARARAAAADRVVAAGYRRTDVSAGFEYDFYTQLVAGGHVNDARLVRPRGAYDPAAGGPTPAVHPRFRVEFTRGPDTEPSVFGSVGYFSLVPPFHRSLFIDRTVVPAGATPGTDGDPVHGQRPTGAGGSAATGGG